ncbi:MAG: CHASE domain-containing protein [Pseudomonadota bacterium]
MLTLRDLSSKRPAMWIGLPLSVAVGFVFFVATARFIEADARQRFSAHAHNARNTIVARIKSYTDVARSAAAMVQTTHPTTRPQFHTYVDGLDLAQHFPAIETLNFGEYVRDEDRDTFEKRMRKETMPDGSPAPPFSISPPGRRPDYNVTTFFAPMTNRIHLIGWDLQTTPGTSPFYVAMRDHGHAVTSGNPIMTLSGKNRTVLSMRVPAFLPNMPTRTIHERRRAFIGSVGMAFSINTLLRGVIDEMPVRDARMTLVDAGLDRTLLPNGMLFDSTGGAPAQRRFDAFFSDRFTQTLPVDFNGRRWDATFSVDSRDMYSGFEEFIPWLAMLAGFISAMLLYALFHALTSSRRRAIKLAKGMTRELRESQAKLQLSHQNLRRLAAHADQIKEGERKRIAREIHDDLGQNLLALRIDADMLANRTRAQHSRLHERACATLFHIDVTIKSVRQIINDLRPNVLDLGLSAAVEWQIAEFKRRTGIHCELIDESADLVLNEQAATAFFRILQESLSNILRHARASKVRVVLRNSQHTLAMTVSDDGIGVGAAGARKPGSFGLVGIEERISILNGTFSIYSNEGEGTTVSVSVPLEPATTTALTADMEAEETLEFFLHSSELS